MYAAIQYTGIATPEEAITDIVGVATGSITSVTGLSANANQGNSTVTTTIAGGWTLWDDVSATQKVIRQVVSDMPGRYKYVMIEKYQTDRVINKIYADWNNVSHTGTQMIRYITGSTVAQDLTCYLFYGYQSKDSMTCLSTSTNHFGGIVVYNNLVTEAGMTLLSEHTRNSLWDTVDNDILPYVFNNQPITNSSFSQHTSGYEQWWIKPEVIGNTGIRYNYVDNNSSYKTQCALNVNHAIGASTTYQSVTESFDQMADYVYNSEGGDASYVLIPFGGVNPSTSNYGGDMSSKCGIYFSSVDSSSGSATNDIVTVGGENYRVWRAATANYKYILVQEK